MTPDLTTSICLALKHQMWGWYFWRWTNLKIINTSFIPLYVNVSHLQLYSVVDTFCNNYTCISLIISEQLIKKWLVNANALIQTIFILQGSSTVHSQGPSTGHSQCPSTVHFRGPSTGHCQCNSSVHFHCTSTVHFMPLQLYSAYFICISTLLFVLHLFYKAELLWPSTDLILGALLIGIDYAPCY